MKKYNLEQLTENQVLDFLSSKPISRVQIAKFCAATNDFNPLFLDHHFANEAGFGGNLVPGNFILALCEDYLHHILHIESITELSVTFEKLVWPGEEIQCQAQVITIDKKAKRLELHIKAQNHSKEIILQGTAICVLE